MKNAFMKLEKLVDAHNRS